MSTTVNEALIQRFYAEGINDHDAAAAAAFYALEALNHGNPVGRAGMLRVFDALLATFPDTHFEIVSVTAQDDRVVCKALVTGTHQGEPMLSTLFNGMLRGVAPTGKRIRVLQFHEFRIQDGLIAEHGAVRDDLEMLLQLGIVTRRA